MSSQKIFLEYDFLFITVQQFLTTNEQINITRACKSQVPLVKHVKIAHRVSVKRIPENINVQCCPVILNVKAYSRFEMHRLCRDPIFANVEKLQMKFRHVNSIPAWPRKLKELKLCESYDQIIRGLPDGLISLECCGMYNQLLVDLPASLENLTVDNGYMQSLVNNLPIGLRTLDVDAHYKTHPELLPTDLPICRIKVRECIMTYAMDYNMWRVMSGMSALQYST